MVVYKITNKINGKLYIGQTINSLNKRFADHCRSKKNAIGLAINKYGRENFTIEVIFEAKDLDELNMMEKRLINELNTISPNGYNLREGGNSKGFSDESRKKMSISARKKPPTTEETKRKLSLAFKGSNHPNFGKSISLEQRKILSEYAKNRTGEKNPMYGKNHTEEVKQKQSKRARGSSNGFAKMNEDKVKLARYFYDNKLKTVTEIAEYFDMSYDGIHGIVKRRSWKHVEEE